MKIKRIPLVSSHRLLTHLAPLLAAALALLPAAAQAQGWVEDWVQLYNGPANDGDSAGAIAVDASGNVYVFGHSQGVGSGWDYATIKYSSVGVPLWTRRYNGPANGDDLPGPMTVDASGNVCVTGRSSGSDTDSDWATIAYSSAGGPLWTNRYNGTGNGGDFPTGVAVDASGNAFVTGFAWGTASYMKFTTIAYSSTGVPLWTNRNADGQGIAIAVDTNAYVYVTGNLRGPNGNSDYGTVKYSPGTMPPVITRQPLSRTNVLGTIATFTVEVAGSRPFSYQWHLEGTNLVDGGNFSGVTTTNLVISNVQPANAGGYSVRVANDYGSRTSSVAQLTVYSRGRFTHPSYSPTMGFSFIFRDATLGRPYRIQVSPSPAEGGWVDWHSFTYNGPIGLLDLDATGAERRFYRAISP